MIATVAISSCVLWACPLFPWSGREHRHVDSAETEYQAAQITLLVLRATVRGAASARNVFILPSRVPLAIDQAAHALAILRKPVQCTGGMKGAILAVTCQPEEAGDVLEFFYRSAALHISTWEAAVKKRCPGPIDEARLLLRRGGTSVTVPFDALKSWFRSYYMDVSLGGDQTASLPQGVCFVIEVGPGGTMKIRRSNTGPTPS